MKVAIILNCGEQIKRKINADKVIACDGGYNVCPVEPDIILGDFDSLQKPEGVDIPIVEHDTHKNASDGELAVYYAKEQFQADEIVLFGVTGGRVDHVLCNLAIMRLASTLGMKVKAEEDGLDIHYVEGEFDMPTQKAKQSPFSPTAVAQSSRTRKISNIRLTNLCSNPTIRADLATCRLAAKCISTSKRAVCLCSAI